MWSRVLGVFVLEYDTIYALSLSLAYCISYTFLLIHRPHMSTSPSKMIHARRVHQNITQKRCSAIQHDTLIQQATGDRIITSLSLVWTAGSHQCWRAPLLTPCYASIRSYCRCSGTQNQVHCPTRKPCFANFLAPPTMSMS